MRLLCRLGIHDWRRREETINGVDRRILICELCKRRSHYIGDLTATIVFPRLGIFIGKIWFDARKPKPELTVVEQGSGTGVPDGVVGRASRPSVR